MVAASLANISFFQLIWTDGGVWQKYTTYNHQQHDNNERRMRVFRNQDERTPHCTLCSIYSIVYIYYFSTIVHFVILIGSTNIDRAKIPPPPPPLSRLLSHFSIVFSPWFFASCWRETAVNEPNNKAAFLFFPPEKQKTHKTPSRLFRFTLEIYQNIYSIL